MLWLMAGDLGAGKTMFMVLHCVSSHRQKVGNLTIHWDGYQQIEPLDLEKVFDADVFLDELQNWIESHFYGSYQNDFITNICNQSQKRGIDMFGTIHTWTSIDYRFRRNCNRLVLCERVGKEPIGLRRAEDKRDFKYTIMNTYDYSKGVQFLKYNDAVKYFDLYNTWELIAPQRWDILRLEMLKNTEKGRKELYGIIEKMGENVRPTIKGKITHASVKIGMLKVGLHLSYEDLVYSYLQDILTLEN